MAVGLAITSANEQYNGRMTWFVVLSCMVAATGGLIFGYDIGISGGVTSMEPFLRKFFPEAYTKMNEDTKISNYCKFDSQLLTSFTSSLYVAGLIASFFASSVTRAFGRKPSILIGGAAFLAGAALGGAASDVYMLIFGRILLGVGVGFANQSVPLYLSEMAPPRYRGAFNMGFQFCVGIGVLSANLINYSTQKIKGGWGWRISLAMAAVPAAILTLGALFLPETPNSLIQQSNNHGKAKRMLERVRGTDDVQAELEDLIKASEISKTIKHPFKNIIQRKYRPQLVMSIAIPFFQQVTGINVISFYAPVLFRTIGLGESASLMSAVVTGLMGTGGVTSMEPFLKKFFPEVFTKMKEDTKISNYCRFDNQMLTSFTSSLYVSGLIASFFASRITRAFGRKPSILIGGAVFLAGAALGGAASNVYMLIFGRVFLGVGVGFGDQAISPSISVRNGATQLALNIGFQFCVGFGVLLANLINYGTQKIEGGWGWRISLAMAAAPASILTLGALFLPETPNSIIQRSNYQKAKRMLERIRCTSDVQAELDDLIKASQISKTTKHPFKNITQRKYRPQFVMSLAIPFFQQVTGINVISFYAPLLFRTICLGESASLMSAVVTGLVKTSSISLTLLLVDKIGRKRLFTIGGIQMFVSKILIGGILAAKLEDHGGLSKGYALLVTILICIYVAGFGLSWGPLGWLVPSEIYPLEIRSAGQSITVAVGFFFIFLVAQTFLAKLCHFKAGIFFFFGGWVAVTTVFVHLFLPETKNVPLEVMDRVWMEHCFWKRFVVEEHEVTKTGGA
ncbi:hypothetical protein RJ639_041449 [Escallonia herrerae]|uniref:Major facilitator superfamily (MFS) profile domain-containing protein n=1 Tax=Escallonia herrerae TaxID=1293975 RepID=A0AA88WG06_9ASTE|nr:hypothetical protein RJ639_041449 [Escallonia herrerae]